MITPPALALAAGKTPYELSMICTGDHDAGAVDTTMNKYLCCDLGPGKLLQALALRVLALRALALLALMVLASAPLFHSLPCALTCFARAH